MPASSGALGGDVSGNIHSREWYATDTDVPLEDQPSAPYTLEL